ALHFHGGSQPARRRGLAVYCHRQRIAHAVEQRRRHCAETRPWESETGNGKILAVRILLSGNSLSAVVPSGTSAGIKPDFLSQHSIPSRSQPLGSPTPASMAIRPARSTTIRRNG